MFTLLFNGLICDNGGIHHFLIWRNRHTGIKLDQRDSRRAVADCKMQIQWAQRASQHRAHFLYNPSEPFRFTWGVSSSRTIDLHLIWFLPGVTFHHSPDTGTFVDPRWRIRSGWSNNDFHSSGAKLCLYTSCFTAREKTYRHTSCCRPVTFTVLLFITDNSQNPKYCIPHKLPFPRMHHILPRRLCKPNLKQPWLRDMFYCWLCSCYHLGCLKRGQIESALCLFNKRILVSARSDDEAVR